MNRKKWTKNPTTRIMSASDTLDNIIPICKKIGVTRVAEITYLDRLFVPNYSVVLPGTKDKIWVYGGKGTTKENAKASALMEAIERYSSISNAARNFIQGSYKELSKKYGIRILHPAEVIEPLRFEYKNDMMMDFLVGVDLLSNQKILVPAQLALYVYSPSSSSVVSPFESAHTNGIASGNVIEEAICHSLCELIERDAWSISTLYRYHIPYTILKKITEHFIEKGSPVSEITYKKYVPDQDTFPEIDISKVEFQPVKDLLKRFSRSQIPLTLKNITTDIGIPTIAAYSFEWLSYDYPFLTAGHGTHPDARIALARAITELSQSRAAHFQGARDDFKKIRYDENDYEYYTSIHSHISSQEKIKFSEIRTYVNNDILDDIRLILKKLHRAGLNRAVIVNLTHPKIGIPVVRAIVPGLESFEISHKVIGRRAKKFFNKKLLVKS